MNRCCLTCTHGALRDEIDAKRNATLAAMAKRGFVNCTASSFRMTFHPTDYCCPKFSGGSAELVAARRAWLAKKHAEEAASASPPPSRASED